MKRFVVLCMVLAFCFAFATQPAARKESPLEKYQAKSPDEEKIIDLVMQFENGYSTGSKKKILSVYAPDAMIQTSTSKMDWKGVLLPKEKHAKHLSRQLKSLRRMTIKLEVFPPETIGIKGNAGYWTGRYKLYATAYQSDYIEEGIINFEFQRTEAGWLISKRTWEITECNHPDFKD